MRAYLIVVKVVKAKIVKAVRLVTRREKTTRAAMRARLPARSIELTFRFVRDDRAKVGEPQAQELKWTDEIHEGRRGVRTYVVRLPG